MVITEVLVFRLRRFCISQLSTRCVNQSVGVSAPEVLYQPECWCFGPGGSVSAALSSQCINRSVGVSDQGVLHQSSYHLRVRKSSVATDVEDKERIPAFSLGTSVHPPAIKSIFHLKHLSSKPPPRKQTTINYSCVRSSHECLYSSPSDQ